MLVLLFAEGTDLAPETATDVPMNELAWARPAPKRGASFADLFPLIPTPETTFPLSVLMENVMNERIRFVIKIKMC